MAGLFLFVPLLLESGWAKAVQQAGYPGTEQIPTLQAMLALLAPKLIGKRRVSHVADLSTDEGAGLFAGLNVLPKTTYATDYSYRTERVMNERLVDALVQTIAPAGIAVVLQPRFPCHSLSRRPRMPWRTIGWPSDIAASRP